MPTRPDTPRPCRQTTALRWIAFAAPLGFLLCTLHVPSLEASAGGKPGVRLAGRLPHTEEAILGSVRRAGLEERTVRIAADTNGFITVAAVTLTYRPSEPDPLQALQTAVGTLLRRTFADVPVLDELDVTALEQRPGPSDGNRWDVGFTAAASRAEVRSLSPLTPAELARRLPRTWVHPSFPHVAPAVRSARASTEVGSRRTAAGGLQAAWDRIDPLRIRLLGMLVGGVVDGTVSRARPPSRSVALTFDDGPYPLYTPLLLDTLRRLGVHATFFLVGHRVEQYPYFARAIVEDGHEVGNHGYRHVPLARLQAGELEGELQRAQGALEAATGVRPRYLRPPGGGFNRHLLRAASTSGLVVVLWTDDPADYRIKDPDRLRTRVLSRVFGGGVVLLHQGVPATLQVLPELVRTLRRLNYHVGTVTDLLHP